MTDNLRRSLRAAGVSFALLTAAAPLALADPPGDLFADFDQQAAASSTPMQAREHAVAQNRAAASSSTIRDRDSETIKPAGYINPNPAWAQDHRG